MNIILTFLLIIIFGLYLWYLFSIIYHLIRFGIGKEPKLISLFAFWGSIFFLALAFLYFSQIDWNETLNFILKRLKLTFPEI